MTARSTQQRAVVAGRIYLAEPTPHNTHTCAGCAASSPTLSAPQRSELCQALPPCSRTDRADQRNITWKPAP